MWTSLHKVLILGGLSSIAISNGLIFGQSGGMINSLRKNEDGLNLTESDLLLSTCGLITMNFFGFGLATISDKMGRRWPFIISSVAVVVQWVIIYKAQNGFHFILSRIIAGTAFGMRYSLNILVTSEYTSPKTRAFFLNIITTVSPVLGTSLGHYLGNIYHWRTVALILIFPSLLGVVSYFWVESPHWLASKGRFQECEEAFRKLHGNSLDSEQELQLLIKVEKCKLNHAEKNNSKAVRTKLLLALKKKYFWNLMLLSFFFNLYISATGKIAFVILASQIIADMTGNPNVLLYTMLVDVLVLIGSCLSCVLIRKMTMRTVLFSTGYTASSVLVILSASLYFGSGIEYLRWVNVALLGVYFVLIEAGPSPVLDALMGEIYPLEIKLYCFFISGSVLSTFLTISLILFPILAEAIGYYGTFLLNSIIMSICLAFIWLKLPETKGRTLQEIETFFKTKIFDVDDALNDEKKNMLI